MTSMYRKQQKPGASAGYALEPAARPARVVRTGLSSRAGQTVGLGLTVLTLLSHGEPYVKKPAAYK